MVCNGRGKLRMDRVFDRRRIANKPSDIIDCALLFMLEKNIEIKKTYIMLLFRNV